MIGIYLQKSENVFTKVAYIATMIVSSQSRSNACVARLFIYIIYFNIIRTTKRKKFCRKVQFFSDLSLKFHCFYNVQ